VSKDINALKPKEENSPILAQYKSGCPRANGPATVLSRDNFAEKHILRIRQILDRFDPQKVIYPNGLLGELKEDYSSDSGTVKRIELFAENKRSKETFGVIRNLFVGFSFERDLLDLANFSNNVISVRAVSGSREHSETKLVEDKLVLKRIESPSRPEEDRFSPSSIYRRQKIPSLIVSSRWLEKMGFSKGDRIIVSNPVENYVTPPPELAGGN
jgi:hypothetical protein